MSEYTCGRCCIADDAVRWDGDFAQHPTEAGCFYALVGEIKLLRTRAEEAEQAHRLMCVLYETQGERIKKITGERDTFKKQLRNYLPFTF